MLAKRYLISTKNLPAIMARIVEGTAPAKFTQQHLKDIGFASSSDRSVLPLLKDLGFLASDGSPTERYHAYRDKSRSKRVMGEALIEAYADLFTINENPTESDRKAIQGKFTSAHNSSVRVAQLQAMTFLALLELADLDAARRRSSPALKEDQRAEDSVPGDMAAGSVADSRPGSLHLRYNIEVHLPPTKDIGVYNAIFKSLKEHLLAS